MPQEPNADFSVELVNDKLEEAKANISPIRKIDCVNFFNLNLRYFVAFL